MRFPALALGILLLPVVLMAYSSNPPLGLSGAPGEGTCASCHSPLTTGSGVSVTFPSALTYTPGGPPMSLIVALASSGSSGFELSSRVMNDNSQAGSLSAGTSSAVGTSGSIQYAYQSSRAASWTLGWTPPATDVGNVVVYVVGVSSSGSTYANSYTLTPASSAPSETLALSSSTLSFSYGGTAPPAQTVQVTSSGASIAITASVSTSSGGNWLSATPAGGNTPQGLSIAADPSGLATGTYTGTVTVASTGATNSPQTISVTFDVTSAPPPVLPTIAATPTALSFNVAAVGGTAPAQTLAIAASDTSAQALTAAATTTSGGSWLMVSPTSGSTPGSFSVSVDTTGLAAGTYMGSIGFTSAGATNSPLAVPVTLTVAPPTPQTVPLQYSFYVVDKQTGGTDSLLLTGGGAIDGSGHVTGGGNFTRFRAGSTPGSNSRTISMGTWKAASVVSYTPTSATSTSGGVLVLMVNMKTSGGSSTTMPATMRIADTGTDSGITLTITGGDAFAPTGTGRVSITAPTTGCPVTGGGDGDGDGDDGGTTTPPKVHHPGRGHDD